MYSIDEKEQFIKERKEKSANCMASMQGRVIEYIPDKTVTIAFPILENYLNPAGAMQGGFICAAFDNAFGALCMISTQTDAFTTLDLHTKYHKPIYPGDELLVKVYMKSKGRTIVNMLGEALNKQKQLIASSDTTCLLLDKKYES